MDSSTIQDDIATINISEENVFLAAVSSRRKKSVKDSKNRKQRRAISRTPSPAQVRPRSPSEDRRQKHAKKSSVTPRKKRVSNSDDASSPSPVR